MSRRTPLSRRRGFTLIELLVVIGIMAVLMAILVPTVMSIRRNAEKNAARLDLNTIALALEAYKKDFRDYPRPPVGTPGYRILAWALIGPFDADVVNAQPSPATDPWGNRIVDGADGPGFRTVWDATKQKGGKVWGPYLPPDKFPLVSHVDYPTSTASKWDIADRYGAPIEYFPRWRVGRIDKANPANSNCLFGGGTATTLPPIYDFRQQWLDNPSSGSPDSQSALMRYLRRELGDDYTGKGSGVPGTPPNDVFDPQESVGELPPFILVSRGPSRLYPVNLPAMTPDDLKLSLQFDKCEVITNLQH
jgi:general secretion pathway protein G